ncbi:inactive rhomboid protein [Senna tora]|uniref:Inactive rhomboid protein n=1 Tax=Senna tora TaxID=362788 RepID=A0A834W9B3_9FABA|nr:inactive rhomboid protein [Senna tora]
MNVLGYFEAEHTKNVRDWKEIYDFNVLEPTFVPESHSVFADQALASHLFTPIQRFLIVAVIGVAVVESRKNYQICQLKKSVQLKDEVLSSMQQKLDNLLVVPTVWLVCLSMTPLHDFFICGVIYPITA